jgi:two-component system phosphate regulon sensor histidine kinase PhoR
MDRSSMLSAAVLLALASGLAMVLAGASPWLALGVVATWLGSLWLARPEPAFEARRGDDTTISREAISPFIEPLGVPLVLLDGERIVSANKAAREALGQHILGQDARVALRRPEAIALLSDDQSVSVTVPGLTVPGSVWQLSRFRIDDRFRLIEFVNRTAEADMSKAHTDFVANASHELRTPLASIIGFIEVLRDAGPKVDAATAQKFLGTMDSEARRMQALVEDLMSLSRIEAEKHDAPRSEVDLTKLVQSVARDVGEVRGHNRVEYAGEGEALILGETSQLDQLTRNLIDNAFKYGDTDAPVRVSTTIENGKAVLRVADRGPGIAREHLPYLTRRFYRTDPGRSRASGGTGLGLAIVKHIVERHRGDLDIASVEGEGTTVTVRIPLASSLSQ